MRELLDAKRNRKSEQLSAEQLALFAELLQARQAQAESPVKRGDSDDDAAGGGTGDAAPKKRTGGRQPLPKNLLRERIVHDLAEEEKHCTSCRKDLPPIGEETSERYEYMAGGRWAREERCRDADSRDGNRGCGSVAGSPGRGWRAARRGHDYSKHSRCQMAAFSQVMGYSRECVTGGTGSAKYPRVVKWQRGEIVVVANGGDRCRWLENHSESGMALDLENSFHAMQAGGRDCQRRGLRSTAAVLPDVLQKRLRDRTAPVWRRTCELFSPSVRGFH